MLYPEYKKKESEKEKNQFAGGLICSSFLVDVVVVAAAAALSHCSQAQFLSVDFYVYDTHVNIANDK